MSPVVTEPLTLTENPVFTELDFIGKGGPRAISRGTHIQSIIQGGENIVHGDVITHMLTNPTEVSLESDSFPFDPEQAKTLIVASLVERKRVASEQHLGRVCHHMSDDATMNYVSPSFDDALGMGSPANIPRSSLPNEIEFCDEWVHVGGSTF